MNEFYDRFPRFSKTKRGHSLLTSRNKLSTIPISFHEPPESKYRKETLLKQQEPRENPEKSLFTQLLSKNSNPLVSKPPPEKVESEPVTESKAYKELERRLNLMVAQHEREMERLKETEIAKRMEVLRLEEGNEGRREEIGEGKRRVDELKGKVLEEEKENEYMSELIERNGGGEYEFDYEGEIRFEYQEGEEDQSGYHGNTEEEEDVEENERE